MTVSRYHAKLNRGEEYFEVGIVVAKVKSETKEILCSLTYPTVRLKKRNGVRALIKRFRADLR